jgi:hypothetical protein
VARPSDDQTEVGRPRGDDGGAPRTAVAVPIDAVTDGWHHRDRVRVEVAEALREDTDSVHHAHRRVADDHLFALQATKPTAPPELGEDAIERLEADVHAQPGGDGVERLFEGDGIQDEAIRSIPSRGALVTFSVFWAACFS